MLISLLTLAERTAAYPEPTMFGTTPAYGFFVRHVRGITVTNVGIHAMRISVLQTISVSTRARQLQI